MTDITTQTGDGVDTDWFGPETATFGDRVAGARDAIGMTQKDLAKRLGVKLKTVLSWEDDLEEPRANKLQMLSGVLNVSLTWLLNGQGQGLDGPQEPDDLPGDAREMLAEMRELSGQADRISTRLRLLEKRLRACLQDSQ